MAVTLPQNFDFRSSAAFVTDPANSQSVTSTPTNFLYPETASPSGMQFGWLSATNLNFRDRSATVDPRLAGVNYTSGAFTISFRADLPAPGTYPISLALGDATSAFNNQQAQIFDGATLLATIGPMNIAAGHFADATGTVYTSAAWPGSNTPVNLTFAGTELLVVLGSGITGSFSTIAYLGIGAAAGGTIAGFGSSLFVSRGQAAPTGIGVLKARTLVAMPARAGMIGTGPLKGRATSAAQAKARLTGTGTLKGHATSAMQGRTAPTVHGALAGSARGTVQGRAKATGLGTLTGHSLAASQGRGALTGAGSLFGFGHGLSALQGRAALAGTGLLTARTLAASQGRGSLSGAGVMFGFAAGRASLQGRAVGTVRGALAGYSRIAVQGRSHPTGIGPLSGRTLAAVQGQANPTGHGTLAGFGRGLASLQGHAAPTVHGALTGYSMATVQARAHPAGVGALAGHSLTASQGHGTLTGAGQLQGWGRAMAAVFGTGVLIPIGIYGQYPPWPPDAFPPPIVLSPSIVRPQQRLSVVSPQRRTN